jgi:hypothetical protein
MTEKPTPETAPPKRRVRIVLDDTSRASDVNARTIRQCVDEDLKLLKKFASRQGLLNKG